jgi:hypothetical protein
LCGGKRRFKWLQIHAVHESSFTKMGLSETGGFGFTAVVPKKEGVNGWGLFYFQGMFGKFWHINIEKKYVKY